MPWPLHCTLFFLIYCVASVLSVTILVHESIAFLSGTSKLQWVQLSTEFLEGRDLCLFRSLQVPQSI